MEWDNLCEKNYYTLNLNNIYLNNTILSKHLLTINRYLFNKQIIAKSNYYFSYQINVCLHLFHTFKKVFIKI